MGALRSPCSLRGRSPPSFAALAALTLIPAAPAAADSIAYVQGGNVFLSTPDGARKVQVTTSGIYSSVSQADDGTMIALTPGERLHKLSRDGKVLADFLTPISDGAPTAGPVNKFHGPFNPQISPASPIGEILRYTLENPRDEAGRPVYTLGDLKAVQDFVIQRELLRVPRVAGVTGIGGLVKRYEVQPDPDRLRRYGITLGQLQTALGNANTNGSGDNLTQGQLTETTKPKMKVAR